MRKKNFHRQPVSKDIASNCVLLPSKLFKNKTVMTLTGIKIQHFKSLATILFIYKKTDLLKTRHSAYLLPFTPSREHRCNSLSTACIPLHHSLVDTNSCPSTWFLLLATLYRFSWTTSLSLPLTIQAANLSCWYYKKADKTISFPFSGWLLPLSFVQINLP